MNTFALTADAGGLDLGRIDPYVLAAIGAAVVIGGVWALARGVRRDAMLDLARWCESRGLTYVKATERLVVGRFAGEVDGRVVTVDVLRIGSRALTDLPPTMTYIRAAVSTLSGPVLVQSAAWVMAVDGSSLPPRRGIISGAAHGDVAIYAADAAAERLMTEPVRSRLAEADAAGLAVTLGAGEVVTAQPGVVAEAAELDRRLELVLALARMIDDAD